VANVGIGQVWKDNDKRQASRFVLVTRIWERTNEGGACYAICRLCNAEGQPLTKRETRIRLDRFRPTSTGYVLVKEATGSVSP
jgi:hypothetical protein